MIEWLKRLLFGKQVEELTRLSEALNRKEIIYTTIKTFLGMDRSYYGWIKELLIRDEYKFMLFDLRENILRELSLEVDKNKVQRHLGRVDMINVIDNYLNQYVREYEASIRGNTENTEN